MTRIIVTGLIGAVLSGILGYLLLPVLRALKAGQSIREVGPTWHNNKAGTPMMGGLMFIFASILCLLGNIPSMNGSYTVFYVLAPALCFGLVGFLDDFTKIKYKRNLGLTSIQKAALQMAVSAIYLYVLFREGTLANDNNMCNLYIPFWNVTFEIHPIAYIFFALSTLWDETRRLMNPQQVYVDLSAKLYDLKIQLLDQMSNI